jgi:hypothetical protein
MGLDRYARNKTRGLCMYRKKHVRQQRYCLAVAMQRFARDLERDRSDIEEKIPGPGFAVICLVRQGQTLCPTNIARDIRLFVVAASI